MTRVLFIADPHCGHRGGIVPPPWQYRPARDMTPRDQAWASIQAQGWELYASRVAALQPIDIAIHMGDAIEGPGRRSGGMELITTDMVEQAEMAMAMLAEVQPRRGWTFVYGTPYHTAGEANFDGLVAAKFGAPIHTHDYIEIDGVTFDLRHKMGCGRSEVAWTNQIRDAYIWHERHGWPLCDWIIRAHRHDHRRIDKCISCPGLQLWSHYGATQVDRHVDFGLVWCDIEGGVATWDHDIRMVASATPGVRTM